jgi:hypothetical protein
MSVKWNWRVKTTLLTATVLPFIYNACGDVSVSQLQKVSSIDEGSSLPAYTKPALAVRGAMCLACHGTVKGDVITDFGWKNTFFLSPDQRYSMRSDAWSSFNVDGTLVVPKALTNDRDPASLSIKDAIQQVGGFRGTTEEKSEVYIGAPTEEVITNLARRTDAVLVKEEWDVSAYTIGAGSYIRGLVAQQGPQGDFFWTNPTAAGKAISCEGDVVLLGPVHFKNLNLVTTAAGCRIYTRNTVFLQGDVNYSAENGPSQNLQISSARAIFVGLRDIELRTMSEHSIGIRAGGSKAGEDAFNLKLIEDREKIGDFIKEDTGPFKIGYCNGQRAATFRFNYGNLEWRYLPSKQLVPVADTSGCSYTSDWAGREADGIAARASHSYSGLVLNAPRVQGRYLGTFKGLVIAEDALFAVDKFKFEFDPIFSTTNVLPLMQGRILRVSQ